MKTKLFLILGTLVSPFCANNIEIDYLPNSFQDSHWDLWAFKYDPLRGWSSFIGTGNTGMNTFGMFDISSDTLPEGESIPLLLKFRITLSTQFEVSGEGDYIGPDGGRENFAGMDSADLSTKFRDESFTATVPFSDSATTFTTIEVLMRGSGQVGETWITGGISFQDHTMLMPNGLQVFDPSQKAGFQIQASAGLQLVDIAVANKVPDGG